MGADEIARNYFEQIWNQKQPEAIYQLLASRALIHHERVEAVGPDQYYDKLYLVYTRAVPDVRFILDAVIAQGAEAVVRWRCEGTQTGQLLSIPPTGRKLVIPGMSWFRVRNQRIVEMWDAIDHGHILETLASPVESPTTMEQTVPTQAEG